MKISYQNKIVAFIDVLGFSNLVNNKIVIEGYFNYLLNDFKNFLSTQQFKYLFISDSIVISAIKSEKNLHELIHALAKIQYFLLLKGILVRGAISFGDLYLNKSQNIIVGQGLINAYKLESKASYPRIIIDRRFILEWQKDTHSFYSTVNLHNNAFDEVNMHIKLNKELNDGQFYINYLRPLVRLKKTYWSRRYHDVTEVIKANFYLNDHFAKYNWLLKELIDELTIAINIYQTHSHSHNAKNVLRKMKDWKEVLLKV